MRTIHPAIRHVRIGVPIDPPASRAALAIVLMALLLGIAIPRAGGEQAGTSPVPNRTFSGSAYVNPEAQAQSLRSFSKQAAAPSGRAERSGGETALESVAQRSDVPSEVDASLYTLTENDLISINIYQEPDLDARLRVAKDGTVNYWLLGSIRVGGKSVQDATRHIRDLLAKDYLVNPQVNVTIVEYARREFTIMGKGIARPGPYLLPEGKPLTIQQAIALAGGYKPGAKETRVNVTRWVSGQKLDFRVDTTALARDRDAKPFLILPDDLITVHESFF